MTTARVRIPESAMARTYEELHEGLPMRSLIAENVKLPRYPVTAFGRMTVIQYKKKTPEPGTPPSYKHPFAPHAQPMFGLDRDKQLWLWTGRYVTTTHGIEDLDKGYTRREKLPSPPKRLITLGRLEWFGYKRGTYGSAFGTASVFDEFLGGGGDSGETGKFEFNERNAPWVAHDENGNLFFLRGNYSHLAEENSYMKRRRSRRVLRANPTEGGQKKSGIVAVGKRVLIATAVVGVVGTATAVGLDMAMARIAYFNGKSAYIKAGAKLGAGVVLGTASIVFGLPSSVGFGLAFGAAISAGKDAYVAYMASRQPASTGTPATGTPAASFGLPAGQGNFAAWNNQYAAVAR